MKSKLLGLGLGVALSTLGVAAVPAMAFADSTCYTGCSAPSQGQNQPPPAAPSEPVSAPTQASSQASGGGLPFTGADIEAMAAVGAGALLVGGALVHRSRRQRRATA
jgi:LPXTG-motif cell wall-anchored protein